MLTIPRTRTAPTQERTSVSSLASEIFKGIPPAEIERILNEAITRDYEAGAPIFLEGDPAERIWFVQKGHVKEVILTPEGRSMTLGMVGQGGMFGTSSLSGGAYERQALAETDSSVLALPIRTLQSLMVRFPAFALGFLADVSRQLRHSQEARLFAQESAEKRILRVLLDLTAQFHGSIPLTRREISEMAGTALETTIRLLVKLKTRGWVLTGRGRIALKDNSAVMAYLGCR